MCNNVLLEHYRSNSRDDSLDDEEQPEIPATNVDVLGMLVEPAATLLPPGAKVFIIPDGGLNTLNFETLLVPGATPHYWIEDATITDASSLRLLATSRPPQQRAGSLLLLGNAVAPNSNYPELRKATAEMESIERHFAPTKQQVLMREQANPAAYLAGKPEQYSYIHFVAHGGSDGGLRNSAIADIFEPGWQGRSAARGGIAVDQQL